MTLFSGYCTSAKSALEQKGYKFMYHMMTDAEWDVLTRMTGQSRYALVCGNSGPAPDHEAAP
jgi:hypothetical protein